MALLEFIPTTASAVVVALGTAFLGYLAVLATYRLYFHPLAHFPGPKLAAATYFYEFYWDVVQPGRLTWHLPDLHKRYGPILRITPDELHILDSSYYDELYARSTGRRHKLPRFSGRFGFQPESFSTWQHDLHRMRRTAINPFFSAKKVTDLQPVIRSNLTKLTKRLAEASKSKHDILPINLAYMALTGDITTTYAFNRSYNQLDSPNFETNYDECLKALYTVGNLSIHFPIVFTLIDASPPWLTNLVNPTVMPIVNFYADCEREINAIRKNMESDKPQDETSTTHLPSLSSFSLASSKTPDPETNPDVPTIFHTLLQTPLLPTHEKTTPRLGSEAVEIVAAGIITTSSALTVGTYHLLANPEILSRLQAELKTHLPTVPSLTSLNSPAHSHKLDWHTLETLPYLSGCVRESIRLSGGVVTRSPRIAPDEPLTYKSHTIPPGTALSMTSWHVSHDPAIFPSPEHFRPDRWISAATGRRDPEMDRWLVAFGKGARQCAGINLAFAELYLTLAVLFRAFDMQLCLDGRPVGPADVASLRAVYEDSVRVRHAYLVPYPRMSGEGAGKGVQIRVNGLLD